MIRLIRYDRAPLQFNPAGGSRFPGRIMRNGLLTYRTADGGTQIEWTPRAVLADAASGFNGAAVTREHPPAGVSPCNWQDVAVGVVLAPKMAKHSDGFEYVEGLLDITRQDASDAVTQGESELSAGYQVVLDPNPGVVPPGEPDAGKRYDAKRVSITPNHVAILGRGRARARREARLLLDSIDDEDVLRLDADGDQIARNVIAEIEKSLGYREAPKQAWQQPGAHPHAEQIAALEKSRSDWQAYEKARAGETEAFNVKLRGLHGRELQGLVK